MKLLLHTCCGPCEIGPLEQLRAKGFKVSGIFYNPNIHPFEEYKKRRQAAQDFSKSAGIEMIYPEYAAQDFFYAITGKPAAPFRCHACWTLRLKMTGKTAKEKGFEAFTTTLLASPYQDQELLKEIGSKIAREEGIDFYYQDFRPGFRRAHNEARQQGLYMQKYCGCVFSEIERKKQCKK